MLEQILSKDVLDLFFYLSESWHVYKKRLSFYTMLFSQLLHLLERLIENVIANVLSSVL